MIFVDTSFWIALAIDADRRHVQASQLFAAHSEAALATSNAVRGETWTFVRRRFGHQAAVGLIDRLAIREVLAFDDDFAAAGYVEPRA